MTNPVGSGPLVQHGDHPPAANDARVAKPAGVSPGHSQEITNSHLKRQSAANDAPIQTRIDASCETNCTFLISIRARLLTLRWTS